MRKRLLVYLVAILLSSSFNTSSITTGTHCKEYSATHVPVSVDIAPVEVAPVTYTSAPPSRGDMRDSYSITVSTVNEFDLRAYTHVGVNQFNAALQGNLKDKAGLILQYATDYNLNCFFIAAVAAQESGWGTSTWATNRNNYFGFGGGKYYNSFEDSLRDFCECITTSYLNEDGPYFNGYTVDAVNQRYCLSNGLPDTDWGNHIRTIMIELHDNAMSVELND